MKKLKRLATLVMALSMLAMPISAADNELTWKKENGTWYAYEGSTQLKGWVKDASNCWYLLDFGSAAMKTGWVAGDATHWYYMNPTNGIMQTGWQTINRQKYYFETSGKYAGAMVTGNFEINGVMNEFGSDGVFKGFQDTSALTESQLEDVYKQKYNIKYKPHMLTDEINTNFGHSFDSTSLDYIPVGKFQNDYRKYAKKFDEIFKSGIMEEFIGNEIINFGYESISLDSFWSTNEPRNIFLYDNLYNLMKLCKFKEPYDRNRDYDGEYNDITRDTYIDYEYLLDMETGLVAITDFNKERYCIYNGTNFDCYKGMGKSYNHLLEPSPERYKNELFSSKISTDDYLQDIKAIDDALKTVYNNYSMMYEMTYE